MAPKNPKQGKNPANRDSQLFRSLTRLFSGPIISYRSESGRKIRRQHLDKYSIHKKSWTFTKDILELTKNADAIIILTESEKFKSLDWEEISKNMRSPSWLFDTRGIVDTKEAIKYKINVWSVGSGELIKKNIY